MNHLCPLCGSPLLCQIRRGKISWFCRHCYQEIPFALVGETDDYTPKKVDVLITQEVEEETSGQFQEIAPINSSNLQEVMHNIVVGVRQFLQCDRVLIAKIKDNRQIAVYEESVTLGRKTMTKASLGHFFSQQEMEEFRSGKIQIVENCQKDDISILEDFFEVKSKLIVPILLSNAHNHKSQHLWGMLIVHQCGKQRKWEESNIGFLSLMANQIAISVQQNQLQTKLTKINQKLLEVISMNNSTRIANQHYFREYLEQQWQEMLNNTLPLSLIICDLDSFEQLNKNHGVKARDECLQKIAQAICKAVKRRKDSVARYHDDKFIILLPDTDSSGGLHVGRLIQNEVYSLELKLTVSLGFASLIPHPGITAHNLVNLAEEALGKAKSNGGDCLISVSIIDQIVDATNKQTIVENLRQTIQDNQEILKSYLAYFLSRGKCIISPNKGKIVYSGLVYQYQGYHQEFDSFWRELELRSDFPQLYIEGDLRCFQDFLVGVYNVKECARCNLPIAVPTGAAYDLPSCHLCENKEPCKNKHCRRRNMSHAIQDNPSDKTNVVVVGHPPDNIYNWQNLLALNKFSVTFISETEALDVKPIEEPVEMILIGHDVNKNTAESWAKELSQHPRFQKVPIIALSSTAGNGLPWLERHLDIEDYLLVPLNGEYLVKNLPQQSNQLYWFPV